MPSPPLRLLLASGNAKKLGELRALLAPLGVEVVAPSGVGGLPEVVEDASTFEGNAAKKARSGALATDLPCLADDSGLCVDALDGAPGVHSARFAAGAVTAGNAADTDNNAKLLRVLGGRPAPERGARFVCALCLAAPDGEVLATFRGESRGRIVEDPRGGAGFGYDPLFEFAEEGYEQAGRTFAELSPADKAAVGHRGRALRQLAAALPELLPRLAAQAR